MENKVGSKVEFTKHETYNQKDRFLNSFRTNVEFIVSQTATVSLYSGQKASRYWENLRKIRVNGNVTNFAFCLGLLLWTFLTVTIKILEVRVNTVHSSPNHDEHECGC